MKKHLFLLAFLLFAVCLSGWAQVDYRSPKEYTIQQVRVRSSSEKLDTSFVQIISGLSPGRKITVPGDAVTEAIEKLWDVKVFNNISISATKIEGTKIWLEIYVEERPRVSSIKFVGLKKKESEEIHTLTDVHRHDVFTEYMEDNISYLIRDYFAEKNYLNLSINYSIEPDPDPAFVEPRVKLIVTVDKGEKVKVGSFEIGTNNEIKKSKIRRTFKDAIVEKPRFDVGKDVIRLLKGEVKFSTIDSTVLESSIYEAALEYFRNAVRVPIFKPSRYTESELEAAKIKTIGLFNAKGYRDAKFAVDSVELVNGEFAAKMIVDPGNKYYIRNINWVGNQKYSSGKLDTILNIKRGDVYNQEKLESNLQFNPNGFDVATFYQDYGYLFFSVQPVEVNVEGDSVDLEIRIYEGKQARVRDIRIIGNTKTNDHVILREIRIKPGDLFNRSDLIRSQQALAALGYFDPQALDVRPIPDQASGMVDLEFVVAEAPSDQIELSGGWGAGQIIGTVGLSFNNFSLRNMFKKGAWNPIPSGDGQKLSIRAQSNGVFYQNYSFSFTEPWLGGKKPISFSVFTYHTRYKFGGTDTSNTQKLFTTSVGLSIGRNLKWPDDFCSIVFNVKYNHYDATKYRLFTNSDNTFTGVSNNFSLGLTIGRYSTDDQIFPTTGSNIQFSVEATPPYSLFSNQDYSALPVNDRYKLLEYHKWKFKLQWFVSLTKNKKFVMMARAEGGFIGQYNKLLGATPFERFYVGGDGLTGFQLDGREIIALRGYANNSLTPGFDGNAGNAVGGLIYSKYSLEFRYLISPNPQAKIFALAFLEAGNAWSDWNSFTPFKVNKSAGVGVRLFLPAFGLLGVDYGWGFDPIPGVPESQRQKGMFHFMIGQQF